MEFFFITHRHLLNLLCMTVRDEFYMFSFRRRAAVFLFPRPAFVCLFFFFSFQSSNSPLLSLLLSFRLFFNICRPESPIKIQESPRGISSKVVCIGRI